MLLDYGLKGKVAVVTGGGGVLCGVISQALSQQGVKVAVLDIRKEAAEAQAERIKKLGGQAMALEADVLDPQSMNAAAEKVQRSFGAPDILINGAGGNRKEATTSSELSFFDLPHEAIKWVFELNCLGTIIPSQVFGKLMAERKAGVILCVSSMNAFRPLTRIPAYSAAKAAVSNFTQWLAVHMAQEYSPSIRVNAIAPGFFLTEQNRFLLLERDGELTPRGKTIIAHTPMGRFGDPKDLIGAVLFLVSDLSSFITGVVLPIDGGFSAFSGV